MSTSTEATDDGSGLLTSCSNAGRWGAEDELGTLNLIDPNVRRSAAGLVRTGTVVALGRPLPVRGSTVAAHPVVHRMMASDPDTALDVITVTPHDPQITHVDALGHTFHDGRAYNGRTRSDVVTADGLASLSVASFRDGIFCRGILLDVAGARGVPFLEAEDEVDVQDLEAAERLGLVRVGAGDALVVHVGRAERLAARGLPDHPSPRAGIAASVLPWLHDRDVAVFLGDCTERLPPVAGSTVPLPLHQVGMVAMGLCLIDGVLTSELLAVCRQHRRFEFLLTCTIPELPGATGFPVNPVGLF